MNKREVLRLSFPKQRAFCLFFRRNKKSYLTISCLRSFLKYLKYKTRKCVGTSMKIVREDQICSSNTTKTNIQSSTELNPNCNIQVSPLAKKMATPTTPPPSSSSSSSPQTLEAILQEYPHLGDCFRPETWTALQKSPSSIFENDMDYLLSINALLEIFTVEDETSKKLREKTCKKPQPFEGTDSFLFFFCSLFSSFLYIILCFLLFAWLESSLDLLLFFFHFHFLPLFSQRHFLLACNQNAHDNSRSPQKLH
jgi:hypothetical protein